MFARIRRMREDDGFTLIELLVVMIIIGILAAIAIPAFLAQQSKARDSAAKSDIYHVATQLDTWGVEHADDWTTLSTASLTSDGDTPVISKGVSVLVIQHNTQGFCLAATNTRGSAAPANQTQLSTTTVIWWWDSAAGGLQPRNTPIVNFSGCPTTTGFAGDVFSTNVFTGP